MKNIDDLKHDLRIEFEEDKKQAEDFFKNYSDKAALQLIEEQTTTAEPSINYTLDGYNVSYSFMAEQPHKYKAILSLYKTNNDGDVINDLAPDYTIICNDNGVKLLDSLDKPIKYIE